MRWIKKSWTRFKPDLGPAWSGFLSGLLHALSAAGCLAYFAIRFSLSPPPAGLFEGLVQIGAALLIAFTVVLAAVRLGDMSPDQHLNWLAFGSAYAVSSLIGIAGCLVLATHAAERGTSDAIKLLVLSVARILTDPARPRRRLEPARHLSLTTGLIVRP